MDQDQGCLSEVRVSFLVSPLLPSINSAWQWFKGKRHFFVYFFDDAVKKVNRCCEQLSEESLLLIEHRKKLTQI